jgi:hypothetical protein
MCNGACSCGRPCGTDAGKHPRTINGLLNASTDADTITAWWTQWPDANIGVALSLSNLIALDVDIYKGDRERLDALEKEHGALPDTLVQLSGSHEGVHVLLTAPGFPVKGIIGGITVRARNYIVVAPSTHKSGNQYQWVNTHDVAAIPPQWMEALKRPTTVDVGIPEVDPPWLPPLDERYLEAQHYLLAQEAEIYQQSPASLTWNVVRNAVRGFALTDADRAYTLIQQVYNVRCVPPWPDDKMAEKVGKAYTEALTPEWGALLKPHDVSLAEIGIGTRVSSKIILDETEPDSDAGLLARALADVQRAQGATLVAGDMSLLFEPATNLFTREFPDTVWLVQGLITEGGIGVIATEPKSAKTWAATEIALAVATGTPAFGEFPTQRKRVAYFYAEDLAPQVRNRIRAMAKGRDLPPSAMDYLHVQPRGRNLDLTKTQDLALLVASCRRIGNVGLLVLDPLRDLHTGEEDKSDSMSVVMRHMRIVATLIGCTVLFVHHSAKSGADTAKRRQGQRMRGSSAIHGSVDSGVYLSNLTGDGVHTFTNEVTSEVKGAKSAGHFSLSLEIDDGPDGTAIKATWKVSREGVRMRAPTESLETKLGELVDALGVHAKPLSTRELQTRCKGRSEIVCAAIVEAEKRGLITNPPGRRYGYVLTEAGRVMFCGASMPLPVATGGVAAAFLGNETGKGSG